MLSSLGKVDFQPLLVTPSSTSGWGSSLLEALSRASQNPDDIALGLGKPFLQKKNPILIEQCQPIGLSINGNALYHTVQYGSH